MSSLAPEYVPHHYLFSNLNAMTPWRPNHANTKVAPSRKDGDEPIPGPFPGLHRFWMLEIGVVDIFEPAPPEIAAQSELGPEIIPAGHYVLTMYLGTFQGQGTRTLTLRCSQPNADPVSVSHECKEIAGTEDWQRFDLEATIGDEGATFSILTNEAGILVVGSANLRSIQADLLGPINELLEQLRDDVNALAAPPATFEPTEIDFGTVNASAPVDRTFTIRCDKPEGWLMLVESHGIKDAAPPMGIRHRMKITKAPPGDMGGEILLEPGTEKEFTSQFEWRAVGGTPTPGHYPITGTVHVYVHGNDGGGRIVKQDLYVPYKATLNVS